jgi:hypothetical protein
MKLIQMMKAQIIYTIVAISTIMASSCNRTADQEQSVAHKETTESNFDDILSKYNTEVPTDILTPDLVNTRIGTLEFFDGLPSEETAEKVFDNLDFMRGVETFLNFIPATSIEGIRRGMVQSGLKSSNQLMIFDDLMDSNPLFLTGNTGTVYVSGILDLERDGPTVVEVPVGCGPSTVNDAFFRFVTDLGLPGPDRGKGGKYLILPPNYEGDIPEGYFVSESPTYINWLIMRGMLVDGKPNSPKELFRNGVKVYPLKAINNQPKMEFINGSGKVFNTIHANTYPFYEELNEVVQREPISLIDPELRGLIASIGIEKGKEFSPDARMKKILEEAVAVGNATARSILFKGRDKNAYIYENSKTWRTAFIGGDYQWLRNKGVGGRNLDARTLFFYFATVNTPAMAWKLIGKGSQYGIASSDVKGNYLYGANSYKLNIPANVPAKDFWSIVVYDPQTRSELQTNQPFPSVNSARTKFTENEDGSIDVYFGPTAPKGYESNWIETVPGKGWFILLRLYGPYEAWFDKTWQPGEIELLEKEK